MGSPFMWQCTFHAWQYQTNFNKTLLHELRIFIRRHTTKFLLVPASFFTESKNQILPFCFLNCSVSKKSVHSKNIRPQYFTHISQSQKTNKSRNKDSEEHRVYDRRNMLVQVGFWERTRNMPQRHMRQWRYSSTYSWLWILLDGGQRSASWPGRFTSSTHWVRGWVGLTQSGCTGEEPHLLPLKETELCMVLWLSSPQPNHYTCWAILPSACQTVTKCSGWHMVVSTMKLHTLHTPFKRVLNKCDCNAYQTTQCHNHMLLLLQWLHPHVKFDFHLVNDKTLLFIIWLQMLLLPFLTF
jgi:hypothetical protein